jgi:magnesium transporter
MLSTYELGDAGPRAKEADHKPGGAMWVDLLNPTPEEASRAAALLGVPMPTREEAAEIESSSRFYTEEKAIFLNLAMLVGVDRQEPMLTPLSFVVADNRVATIRYEDSVAFRHFMSRAAKPNTRCTTSVGVVMNFTESLIDRAADVVEKVGAEVDRISGGVFVRQRKVGGGGVAREHRLSVFLQMIAIQNEIISKSRESLVSIDRMVQFVGGAEVGWHQSKVDRDRLQLMARDVHSLTDQLTFLSSRANFLLEAILGLISVDQNDVIRVLTVAATILLPPTLIGTIYGMNFKSMPELDWTLGYPLALLLMAGAAFIPYLILKRRGWF